jgi:hypothetical protein
MTTRDENYVKILFRFYSNVLDEETAETMGRQLLTKKMDYINWTAFHFMRLVLLLTI